ncbi:helix-turn-helix transcriptional regulator [Burkholderia pseudomallei]|uniref:helix-turn-helix transcriptional regulator n=1 Tax=Burkholderia pseudomallei TaxID=28450 RepID=UPI0019D6D46F|nr:helix-turn-helix domain-containing protein [Burkholderia pseudomallei]
MSDKSAFKPPLIHAITSNNCEVSLMEIISKKELAKLLRISPRTVDYWVSIGKLPRPGYLGRRAFWKRDEITQIIVGAFSRSGNV